MPVVMFIISIIVRCVLVATVGLGKRRTRPEFARCNFGLLLRYSCSTALAVLRPARTADSKAAMALSSHDLYALVHGRRAVYSDRSARLIDHRRSGGRVHCRPHRSARFHPNRPLLARQALLVSCPPGAQSRRYRSHCTRLRAGRRSSHDRRPRDPVQRSSVRHPPQSRACTLYFDFWCVPCYLHSEYDTETRSCTQFKASWALPPAGLLDQKLYPRSIPFGGSTELSVLLPSPCSIGRFGMACRTNGPRCLRICKPSPFHPFPSSFRNINSVCLALSSA